MAVIRTGDVKIRLCIIFGEQAYAGTFMGYDGDRIQVDVDDIGIRSVSPEAIVDEYIYEGHE